jgi:HAD superfamily hydrolase (TIGR01509 family)
VATDLLIFDCDGVLVDSEMISMSVLLETLSGQGLVVDQAEAYEQFLGRSLTTIAEVVLQTYGLSLSHGALDQMRLNLYDRFRKELKAMPQIEATLGAIPIARCVASSSQLERIRLALEVTGLRRLFEPNIFSAAMVARGKPAPDLFLYAASAMSVAPERCLVVEDSPAGIAAAKEAGMRAFGFVGASHAGPAELSRALAQMGASVVFHDMQELPHLVRGQFANVGLAQ